MKVNENEERETHGRLLTDEERSLLKDWKFFNHPDPGSFWPFVAEDNETTRSFETREGRIDCLLRTMRNAEKNRLDQETHGRWLSKEECDLLKGYRFWKNPDATFCPWLAQDPVWGTVAEYRSQEARLGHCLSSARAEALRDKEQPQKADKLDQGKPSTRGIWMLPLEALEAVSGALIFGCNKYSRDGWKTVPGARERYLDAMNRHIQLWQSGESFAKDSGVHHLGHVMANAAFLLWFDLQKGEK